MFVSEKIMLKTKDRPATGLDIFLSARPFAEHDGILSGRMWRDTVQQGTWFLICVAIPYPYHFGVLAFTGDKHNNPFCIIL